MENGRRLTEARGSQGAASQLRRSRRISRQGPTYDENRSPNSWARPAGRRRSILSATAQRLPSGIRRLGAGAPRILPPSRRNDLRHHVAVAGMRLPHRQPRAVYVVRDADDLLGDPEGLPGNPEGEALLGNPERRDVPGNLEGETLLGNPERDDLVGDTEHGEPVIKGEDRFGRRLAAPSSGLSLRHVLAGASLCLTAVFAVVSIVLGLSSLAGRHSRGQRQPAGPGVAVSRSKGAGKGSRSDETQPLAGAQRRATARARLRRGRSIAVAITRPRGPGAPRGATWRHQAVSSPAGGWPDPGARSMLDPDGRSMSVTSSSGMSISGTSIASMPVAAVDTAAGEFGFER